MITNQEWRTTYSNFLETFGWDWFATLTCRPNLTPPRVHRCFHRWLAELRVELGTEAFRCVAAPESGATGLHYHLHAVIGGLRPGWGAGERLEWMKRWYELCGDAKITDFRPDHGGIYYLLKHLGPNDTEAIILEIPSSTIIQNPEPSVAKLQPPERDWYDL